LLLGAAAVALPAADGGDEVRQLVQQQLRAADRLEDSVWAPIMVRALLPGERDFVLVPVSRDGRLVSVFRDDPSRDSVKEVVTAESQITLRQELLTPPGVIKFLADKGITAEAPVAVSAGPMSLFGSLGGGWRIPSQGSFYLLSFDGKLLTREQVATLWPDKVELFEIPAPSARDSL
jgi:hypothetical protein